MRANVQNRKEIMKDHTRKPSAYVHCDKSKQSYMPSNGAGMSIDFRSTTFDNDDSNLLDGVPPYVIQTHDQALANDKKLRVQTHQTLKKSKSHRDMLEEAYERINQNTVERGKEAKKAIASIEQEIRGLKQHLGKLNSS